MPITTRDQFAAEPEAFRLRPAALSHLGLAERTLWGVIYTAGSTLGVPTPFYDTNYDHAARIDQLRETAELVGLVPDDIVLNAFPVAAVAHQGILSALYAPLAVGAKVVAAFPGSHATPFPIYRSTDEVVDRAVGARVTVLWGITSYVRTLVRRAEQRGADLSSVRLAFVAGEPCPPGMRADLRARLARLGATEVVIQNGYGFTEMQGPTVECAEGGPFHVPAAERYELEIVDPDTAAPLPDGTVGQLLVTHLDRRGTVLLRYAVGDVTAIQRDRCPVCGRSGVRIVRPPHRLDNLVKIRGTLVNPDALVAALSGVRGLDEFQVAIIPPSPADGRAGDVLQVRITAARPSDDIAEDVVRAVREACEVRAEVLVLEAGDFARLIGPYKFRRFVDERPARED